MWSRAAAILVLFALGCGPGEDADDTGPGDTGPVPAREVVSDDGRLVLYIPEGALAEDVDITATALDLEELNATADPPWLAAYDLQPPGLQFLEPATITIALDDTTLDAVEGIPGVVLDHDGAQALSIGLAVEGTVAGQARLVAQVENLGSTARLPQDAVAGVKEAYGMQSGQLLPEEGDTPVALGAGADAELGLGHTGDVSVDLLSRLDLVEEELEQLQATLTAQRLDIEDQVSLSADSTVDEQHLTLHTQLLGNGLEVADYRLEAAVIWPADLSVGALGAPRPLPMRVGHLAVLQPSSTFGTDPRCTLASVPTGDAATDELAGRALYQADLVFDVPSGDQVLAATLTIPAGVGELRVSCGLDVGFDFGLRAVPALRVDTDGGVWVSLGAGVVSDGLWEEIHGSFDGGGGGGGSLAIQSGASFDFVDDDGKVAIEVTSHLTSDIVLRRSFFDSGDIDFSASADLEGETLPALGSLSLSTSNALTDFDYEVELGGDEGQQVVPFSSWGRLLGHKKLLPLLPEWYANTGAHKVESGGDAVGLSLSYKFRAAGDVPMPDTPVVWGAGQGWIMSDYETGDVVQDNSDQGSELWACELFVTDDVDIDDAAASMFCADANGGQFTNLVVPAASGENDPYWGWTQLAFSGHRITDVSAYPTGEGATWRVPHGLWVNASLKTIYRVELDSFYTPHYFTFTYAVGDTFYFGTSTPFSADLVDPDTLVLVTEGDADGDPKGKVGWYTLEDSAISWGDEIGDVRRIREHGGYVGITTFTDQSFFYGTWDDTNGVQIAGSVNVGVDLVFLEVTDLDGETVALFAGGTKVFVWHFATATLDTYETPCEAVTSASKVWNRTAVVHNCQDTQGDWTIVPLSL